MIWDFLASFFGSLRTLADVQTWSMIITAAATIALGFFTWVLARETRRLSRATAQAHIVATLEPNVWAINHMDLIVTNTGNATAHDVGVEFSPELENYNNANSRERPLRHVSLLKPGQSTTSYVGEHTLYSDKTYQVTTSWKHRPTDRRLQSLSYELSMRDYEGFGSLGARSPLIQIAEQLKHLREDWQWVPRGSHRINTNTYTSQDRANEQKQRAAQRRATTRSPRKPRDPKGDQ